MPERGAGATPSLPLESLDMLIEREARRVLSEDQLRADPARLAEGWERRFVADALRAKEAVEVYQQLGFEVAADPIRVEDVDSVCTDCRVATLLGFRMIYTRRPRPGPPLERGAAPTHPEGERGMRR